MANDSDSSDESLGGFSSGDDDPFAFQQRKFTKRPASSTGNDSDSDSSNSSCSSSPPAGSANGRKGAKKAAQRGRPKRKGNAGKRRDRSSFDLDSSSSDSSSSDDDKENKKRKSPSRRSVGRGKGKGKGTKSVTECIDLSSDSDSSEDESDKPQLSVASTSSTITRRMTRTAARAAAAAASAVSDSGSSSKRKKPDLKNANKDTVDALTEARQAMKALQEAQKYRAEDVSFELDKGDESDIVCVDEPATESSLGATSAGVAFGSTATGALGGIQASISEAPSGMLIRLNVRVVVLAGKNKDLNGKKVMCKIRTGEKLQQLVDQLSKSCPHLVTGSSDVKLSFDGETLNLAKTPASFDMEDEDLVDALVPSSNASGKVSASTSQKPSVQGIPAASESRVKIRTRIKGGDPRKTNYYSLRKTDPLHKLIGAYETQHRKSSEVLSSCSVYLEYNGRKLKPSSTPEDEGIIDNTLLEINDDVERKLQLQRVSRAGASSPQPGQIVVKCRINGNEKTMQTYAILPTDQFGVVINEFCSRNGWNNTDCTFEFDGEQLKTNQTPMQLDLEGDEIIEVIVSESVLASSCAAPSTDSSNVPSNPAPSSRPRSARSTRSSSSSILNSLPSPSVGRSSRRNASQRSATASSTASQTIIAIQVVRNNVSNKKKKFKLYSTDTLEKLNAGYKQYYKKKGCKRVAFYVDGTKVNDKNVTLASLGLRDMSVIVAMENGKKLTT